MVLSLLLLPVQLINTNSFVYPNRISLGFRFCFHEIQTQLQHVSKIPETNEVYHSDIMIADNNIIQGKNDCVTGSKKQFPSKTKTPIFYLIATALSSRKQSKKYRTSAVTKLTASSSVRPLCRKRSRQQCPLNEPE